MNKYKYLLKNIGLLTVSNFGTKILTFFLVPLYTYVLSESEYGIYDLFNSTVNLLIPICTLNIVESVLRFSIDGKTKRKDTFSIGCHYVFWSSLLLTVFLLINYYFSFIKILNDYAPYFFFMYISTAFLGIITNFARGIEKIADVSIAGIIGSITIIALNIVFLLPMKMGIEGYFLAHIFGALAQSIYLLFRIKAYSFFAIRFDKKVAKEMNNYSIPMIANSIGWWVNNVSDRYIVTWICGISINGIYSVAYKIPSILQVFQTIFNQAWVLSAVKDFDKKDASGFFKKTYYSYNFAIVLICSALIATSRILALFLYKKGFYSAWQYVPFLLISVVFGAMAGYIGGIFSAVKNSKMYAKSTAIGAVVNIFLNVILVKPLGAMGAAIATAVAYWIVWMIRVHNMKSYLSISLNLKRDYLSYILLVIQSCIVIFWVQDSLEFYLVQILLTCIQIVLYKDCLADIKKLVKRK